MADNIFDIEIITPDRVFYKGETEFLEFNTQNGEIGVYKNHIPLTTVLAPGIFKRSPPSQIEHIDTDRRIVDISCRPERTGTGTVRYHHGANESCRGRDRGLEAYPSNGMGAAVQ